MVLLICIRGRYSLEFIRTAQGCNWHKGNFWGDGNNGGYENGKKRDQWEPKHDVKPTARIWNDVLTTSVPDEPRATFSLKLESQTISDIR